MTAVALHTRATGGKPDAPVDSEGNTLLHLAAAAPSAPGTYDLCSSLMRLGEGNEVECGVGSLVADRSTPSLPSCPAAGLGPNTANTESNTALHIAAKSGNVEASRDRVLFDAWGPRHMP